MISEHIGTSGTRHGDIKAWLDSNRSYDAGIKLYFKYGNDPLLTLLFKETYSDFKLQKLHQVLGDMINPPAPAEKKTIIPAAPNTAVMSNEDKRLIADLAKGVDILFGKKHDIESSIDDLQDDHYTLEFQVDNLADDQSKLQKEVNKLKNSPKFIPRGWPKELDETLQSLYNDWLPKFNEKKNLQARIYDIALAGQKDPWQKTQAGVMAHRILDLRDEIRKIYKNRDYYLDHEKLLEEKKPIDIPEDRNKWPLTLQNWQRYVREYKSKLKKKPDNEDFKKQLAKYEWGVTELKKLLGL